MAHPTPNGSSCEVMRGSQPDRFKGYSTRLLGDLGIWNLWAFARQFPSEPVVRKMLLERIQVISMVPLSAFAPLRSD